MKYLFTILFFILGACIISFLKVIALDYPKISFTRRSHCDHCGRTLRWFEIIPIVGYFIVHGKCFRCKNQIDFRNSVEELGGGLLFIKLTLLNDYALLPFWLMLIVLAYSDYFYGYIYPIFYLLILPTLILNYQNIHLLIGSLVYLCLWLLSHKYRLGLGDVEVISLLALIVNLQTLSYVILLACFLCLVSYFFQQKKSYRFIPYLTVASGIIYMIFSFIC